MTLPVAKILVGSGLVLAPITHKALIPVSDQASKAFSWGFAVVFLTAGAIAVGWYVLRDTIEHIRYTRSRR